MESPYYPLGTTHLKGAPWNQDVTEPIVEWKDIRVYVDENSMEEVKFQLQFENQGDFTEVTILDFEYPVFMNGWAEDLQCYFDEECMGEFKVCV